jgi:hypothetical protein
MIRKVLIIALAVSMSAASANAMAPMKGHHMMPRHMMAMCVEGQTKMKCVCASKTASVCYQAGCPGQPTATRKIRM